MFEKLALDAKFHFTDAAHAIVASAETVDIQPGQVQTVHTGLRSYAPLLLSIARGLDHLDMCTLLTTALVDGHEVQVAILNRGTDPVTIEAGEWLLHAVEVPTDELEY